MNPLESRPELIALKVERIASGLPPRVLDLFSGCGGLSLGFQRAGFEILGGVEKEPRAAWTYATNLHCSEAEERRKLLGKSRDICSVSPHELLTDLGCSNPERTVDVLVGGPPCQAYARVGRAKLREIQQHPDAFQLDERGQLYIQYLEYVRQLHPLALLIENVPDILNYGGRNIAWEIADYLRELGYLVNFGLLNAASYGVPQNRRRFYLIALCQELSRLPSLPAPTHRVDSLPSGYREFTAVVESLRTMGTPFCGPASERFDRVAESLPLAVTVRDAIGDLPRLTTHLDGSMRGGRRRFDETLSYAGPPVSCFAREMREGWPTFEAGEGVCDHVIRLLPRDHPIFARMKPGDDYPKAHRIALHLFEGELARLRSAGQTIKKNSLVWKSLKTAIVPPYDPAKFPNKWGKLDPDAPARTLLAHLAHDSYTHIHYDDTQARTLSVREAARLQSFPDGFRFYEAMNPAFRMIGNAVPPLMSFRLAQHLLAELRTAIRSQSAHALAGYLQTGFTTSETVATSP